MLSANRPNFSELLDDISLVLNVTRLCVVVDSRINAAEVCDFGISAWCRHLTGRTRNSRLRKIGSTVGLVSADSWLSTILADKKVIICVLCLNQFVVYSMQNPGVYRILKKAVFC